MSERIISINKDTCNGCGQCKKDCPAHNINITEKTATLKSQQCIKCGHCVAVCPIGAVSMSGFDEPPTEFSKQPLVDENLLLDALKSRRSVRQFQNKPIPAEIIEKIIEAGRWTPTAKNAKSVSYVVLRQNIKSVEAGAVSYFRKIMPLAGAFYPFAKGMNIGDDFFFKGAPVAISIVSSDKVSGSLAASNMALMAESCGLGVLYSGFFTIAVNMSASVRKTLKLSRKQKVVTTLVLGYSNVKYHRTTQKEQPVIIEI